MGELGSQGDQGNINVTLGARRVSPEGLVDRLFPCPLCGRGLPILATRRSKPYCICDFCGLQMFFRGRSGIARLKEMANAGILVVSSQGSATHGIDLYNRLKQLELQKHDLEIKKGIVGIIFPDENLENAISLVDAEIKKIEGELSKIAEQTKDEYKK